MRKFLVVLALVFAPASTAMADHEQSAYSEIVHPQPIAELFDAAVKHGGFTKQCTAEPEFCKMPMVLVRGFDEEGLDGQFSNREPNYIQVSDGLTPGTLRFNETVVHEFVHYLQWAFGEYGATTRCNHLAAIEAKAYLAGAAYLKEVASVVQDYSSRIAWMKLESATCMYGGY